MAPIHRVKRHSGILGSEVLNDLGGRAGRTLMLCLRDVWILVLCLLQIAAISLFISGFFPKQIHSLDSENNEQDVNNFLDECPHDSILRKALKKQTVAKIVIILIDAWQEQFFYRREAMQFLRQLTSDGQAVAFIAHVQTPTVTMPRIKAITAGVIPSFADVVMNFASTSITSDNIIDRLNDKGYRCTFCGDETWLRLFPNRFDNHSAEVTSFYVNDFKEVDDNVTFCMRSRLENGAADTWDVMILHYLGLDHIGHSLGGTHSELNNKLIEMDSIIKEIYEKLHKIYGTNFSIIVFGDHGMTEGGSHGGSSELETHVPIVYVDGRKRRTSNETFYVTSVEQVDIVPTLATLFNVPIPKESLGVTLLPYITTDRSNLSVLLFVLQNAEQFRKLYRTSNVLNHCISNSYDSLQKHCAMNASVNVDGLIGECLEELHKIQSQLIHRKTNFDVIQIVIAIGLSFTVSYISAYLVCSTYLYDIYAFQNGDLSTNLAFFAQLLHFAAPFASSLIEEEHDLQIRSYNSAKSQKIITILFLLIIHRLCRGYTESNRRRWILERNISQSNRIGLLNYYEIFTSIGGSSDMPDIASLLVVFLMVFILNVFLLLLLRDLFLSLIVWAVLIMRTYNLPLAVLQLFLGYCLARIDATPFLIIRAIFSSFFYLAIDIAVGFVGVETYQPIQIAVQILLSTYSGPLLTAFVHKRIIAC
uniref:GPI ethanolamine phosphate transferase 2 n=1 Tax=Wuchereria bancrofti TaxID=6293 RepID=A0A1I8EWF1_WUCBA